MSDKPRPFIIINNGGGRITRRQMTLAFKRARIPSLSVAQRRGLEEYYTYEVDDMGPGYGRRSAWKGDLTDASMERVLAAFYAMVTDPGERRFIEVYHD